MSDSLGNEQRWRLLFALLRENPLPDEPIVAAAREKVQETFQRLRLMVRHCHP